MPRVRLAAPAIGGALGLALLAGCADMQDEVEDVLGDMDDEPRTYAFECDDDREFSVRLTSDREEARVEVGDENYRLEEAGRDDGARVYRDEDSDVRLTMGDDDAYLRIPGAEDYRDCEKT
jgi:Membrane-bound lysozyme-inhibitor of c-type lysozyme